LHFSKPNGEKLLETPHLAESGYKNIVTAKYDWCIWLQLTKKHSFSQMLIINMAVGG